MDAGPPAERRHFEARVVGQGGQAGPAVPQTRTARHRRIVDILNRQPVRSQSQLAKLLADDGLSVTQATLSRDLDELNAVKIRNNDGDLIYAVPSEGGFRTPRAPLGESAKEERMRRLSAGPVPWGSDSGSSGILGPLGGEQAEHQLRVSVRAAR